MPSRACKTSAASGRAATFSAGRRGCKPGLAAARRRRPALGRLSLALAAPTTVLAALALFRAPLLRLLEPLPDALFEFITKVGRPHLDRKSTRLNSSH